MRLDHKRRTHPNSAAHYISHNVHSGNFFCSSKTEPQCYQLRLLHFNRSLTTPSCSRVGCASRRADATTAYFHSRKRRGPDPFSAARLSRHEVPMLSKVAFADTLAPKLLYFRDG